MKVLFIPTANSVSDLMLGLTEMGYDVSYIPNFAADPVAPLDTDRAVIVSALETVRPSYVFSYLFIPMVAEITHSYGIPYISWTYDSPLTSLFTPQLEYDNNYVFIFDKAQYLRLKTSTNANVYHLPLGAYMTRVGAIDISDDDVAKFSADISFVGTLYGDNPYNKYSAYLDEAAGTELNNYLLANAHTWLHTKPWPSLSEQSTRAMQQLFGNMIANNSSLNDSTYIALLFLSKKLAEIDRITLLNALAMQHHVDLYTGDSAHPALSNVHQHGRVSYESDMSKVFYCSKINLNVTLPSIETGVPQRVFDIMASGGFCISNYQEEIDDLFTVGKDIECYRSVDELLDKVNYYLTHDNERLRIAINGYKCVAENHTLNHRISEMFNIVNGN